MRVRLSELDGQRPLGDSCDLDDLEQVARLLFREPCDWQRECLEDIDSSMNLSILFSRLEIDSVLVDLLRFRVSLCSCFLDLDRDVRDLDLFLFRDSFPILKKKPKIGSLVKYLSKILLKNLY